jgi:peptidoglycan biosynthesis protein MviN/MurJ (putative lipid II flippase)
MKLPIQHTKAPEILEHKRKPTPWYTPFKRLLGPNMLAIFTITFFMLASRGLGFLRQVIIYQRFDREHSDLLLAATKIPDTIVSILVMGTIISAFLPVASRIKEKYGLEQTSRYLSLMMHSLGILIGGISLILIIFTEQFLRLTTSKDLWTIFENQGLLEQYISITRILLLGPVLFAMQGVFSVFLSIQKKFLVYSWAGVIYNVGTIAGLLLGPKNQPVYAAIGMVAGAFLTVCLYYFESIRVGLKGGELLRIDKIFEKMRTLKADFIQSWKLFWPRIFIINGTIFSSLIINTVAQDTPGQVTAFDISVSIQAVFFALITSVGLVLFPDLAKLWNKEGEEDTKHFWRKLRFYTEHMALVSLAGAVVTFVAAPVVMWLFELVGKGQNNSDYIVFLSLSGTLFQALIIILAVWNKIDAGVAVALGLAVNGLVITVISLYLIWQDYNREKAYNFGTEKQLAIRKSHDMAV